MIDGAVGPVTRSGARDDARRELSKAIYHRYDEPLPVRVLRWIGREIDHALSLVSKHAPGGGPGALGLVVLVVVVALLARWRLGPIRRDVHVRSASLDQRDLTAADHRRLAASAAESGRWTEAVIEQMRAIARELEENGVVLPRPGRTAAELAVEGGRAIESAARALTIAAHRFDAVVYGGRAAGPGDYADVHAADDAVRGRRVATAAP